MAVTHINKTDAFKALCEKTAKLSEQVEGVHGEHKQVQAGRVALVGAGPGDPDLLTVKALREIQQADFIMYDRLVSEDIRALFPAGVPAMYVGKAKSNHSVPQEQLNQLLVEKALQGLNVCRVKGGDSFVFGRGGEEMIELKAAGIDVCLVPGITAAAGATSYAGIPLTHRGVSQGCTFVTAHGKPVEGGEPELDVCWKSLAGLNHTLVFYMGLSRAGMISRELTQAGLSASTPVALIEKGCCKDQRLVRGQLHELVELVEREQVQSPALIVVGEVVNLADQLDWFAAEQGRVDKAQIEKEGLAQTNNIENKQLRVSPEKLSA